MAVRLLLPDEAWTGHCSHPRPLQSRAGRPPVLRDRMLIEAILSRLPGDVLARPAGGLWAAGRRVERFRRWEARGFWRQLWERPPGGRLPEGAPPLSQCDLHACPSARRGRVKKTGDRPPKLWAALGGLSTNIHAGCRDAHLDIAFVLTAGQCHESPVFATISAQLPQESSPTHAIMDKGYDSDCIREHLVAHAIVPVIPSKSNRTIQ